MSLFNNIEKIKYTGNSDSDLISLVEYIMFHDERKKDKYIVFKFRNNLAQLLFEIKVEVLQYTEDDKLLERSTLHYQDDGIKPLDLFVPNFKFQANPLTKYVSINLKYARFDKIIFENGKVRDNVLTFNEFASKELPKNEVKEIKKKVAQDNKERKVEEKQEKNKRYKRKATVKNVRHHSHNKFTIGLNVVLSLILIGFGTYASINHCKTTDEFTFGEYDVRLNKSEGTATILKYNGSSKEVFVPETFNNYLVTGIHSDAFKDNDDIESIIITSEYCELKSYAINECDALTEIIITSSEGYVNGNAIYDCNNLVNISFDKGVYTHNSVVGCEMLQSFSFKDSYCSRFGDIFSLYNYEVTVKEIYDYSDKDQSYFYEGLPETVSIYKY